MRNNRDKSLDIAKAICIILMVVGHSGCPTYLYDFVYMFHMPCFFFVSGWLLNEKYVTDLKTGLIQKAKGSYYPFVKWTLIFLLFHNVFASMHIIIEERYEHTKGGEGKHGVDVLVCREEDYSVEKHRHPTQTGSQSIDAVNQVDGIDDEHP